MTEKVNSTVILFLIALFDITGFALIACMGGKVDYIAMALGVIIAAVLLFQYNILTAFFKGIDKYVIIIMNFLVAVGLLVIYRIDSSLAYKQLIYYILGSFVMVAMMFVTMKFENFVKGRYVIMGLSIAILLFAILFGKEQYGAKNWINLGGFSIQPSELVKISLVILLASYFANEDKLLKQLPVLAFAAVCMVILLVQKDLGAVVLYFGTALIVYYVCTSNILLSLLGLGLGAGGAVAAYKLFDHVQVRVAVWKNPWIYYENKGYQIVQGLLAIASGGLVGMGLGRGMPSLTPVSYADYIFVIIVEEFGLIVGMAILAFYIVLILRGAIIARYAKTKFHMILAFGCTTLISLQGFIIIAGVIKMIPLTGITLPFISYGGTSLLTCMALMGILLGVSVASAKQQEMTKEMNKFVPKKKDVSA